MINSEEKEILHIAIRKKDKEYLRLSKLLQSRQALNSTELFTPKR